ncbi:glycosyltransferase family 1 protein [Chamaesiphon sp. VAR_48_metabat_135_sub]|uniref:glycosyltransferase family 4 protein n=1 Tax=Chamaesiphon sp. VAR_48_metabat_135_sub TaxID=2964699 RepID=UPI00286AA411|nr:glycosyltransferase family 1 protein [Chamaesiphon sp. VAR_48_metabat_135_sub]
MEMAWENMNLARDLQEDENLKDKGQISEPDRSIIVPLAEPLPAQSDCNNELSISNPRILFEAYPLTLKNGTGIYVYALNLLRGINTERDNNSAGLLLLLNEQINLPLGGLSSSHELKNIQSYAKLLSQLFQTRYPNISRSNRSNNWIPLAQRLLRKILRTIFLPVSFFLRPQAFSFPTVLKSSLTEILNDSFISYDFLHHHQPYLVNFSRSFLMLRGVLKISNRISSRHLAEAYDVFHCTHISPLTVANLPQVTTVHDIVPLIRPELVSSQLVLVFAKLLKANLGNSTRLIAVSQATKDDLVRYCQVPAAKITVVYEAARKEFQPVSAEIARPILSKIGLIVDEVSIPYFVFVGNIEPKKNIKRLLLAFEQFAMSDPRGCKLVMIGSHAWGFDDVKDLMTEMIAAGTLIHPGYLPTDRLPALFSHAQALMLPSLIEGFGLPVLEAMACGCPVITSDIPCIQEIAGDAAIKIDPLSIEEICRAITTIANDESLRANLSKLGLAQNKLFSWERCARETLTVYREAIAEFASNK